MFKIQRLQLLVTTYGVGFVNRCSRTFVRTAVFPGHKKRTHRRYQSIPDLKRPRPTKWYQLAVKEFLVQRAQTPQGCTAYFKPADLGALPAKLRRTQDLSIASSRELCQWRMRQNASVYQQDSTDTRSPAVALCFINEKILNLRRHIVVNPFDHQKKMVMFRYMGLRIRMMKKLYREDYETYRRLCKHLRILCVRFAIPTSRHPDKTVSPAGIDGAVAKFLVRMRLWKGRHRPRPFRADNNKVYAYTRHPALPLPKDFNQPKPTVDNGGPNWPYGVTEERLRGKHSIPNPTAVGKYHTPVKFRAS